jgi:hypothetical protein
VSLDSRWRSATVEVRRYESTVAAFAETGAFETLYATLSATVEGEWSSTESTIMGDFGQGHLRLTFWAVDIDDEKGWPAEKDVVILGGQQYFINKIEDHTFIPAMFTSIKAHKVAHIGENLLEV